MPSKFLTYFRSIDLHLIVFSDRVSIKRRLDDPEIIAEKKSYTVSEDLLKKKLEAEEKQKAEAKRIAEERRKIEEKLKAEQEKLEYLKKISELSRLEYELLEMVNWYQLSTFKYEMNFFDKL